MTYRSTDIPPLLSSSFWCWKPIWRQSRGHPTASISTSAQRPSQSIFNPFLNPFLDASPLRATTTTKQNKIDITEINIQMSFRFCFVLFCFVLFCFVFLFQFVLFQFDGFLLFGQLFLFSSRQGDNSRQRANGSLTDHN